MRRVVSALLAVVVEVPVEDEPIVLEPDVPMVDVPIVDFDPPMPAAPVAAPFIIGLFVAPLAGAPVLFEAGGYCGVAPGMVVDSVVVLCANGAEHHMAAMAAPATRIFVRFFIGSPYVGLRRGSRSVAFSFPRTVWSSRVILTLSAAAHAPGGEKDAYV